MNADTRPAGDRREVPLFLHAVGVAVLLSGVVAVNSVTDSPTFALGVMALSVVGHAFSIHMRRMRKSSRLVEFAVFAVCVVAYLRVALTPYEMGVLQPGLAESGQIRFATALIWIECLRSFTLSSDEAVLFTPVAIVAAFGLVATENVNPELIAYYLFYLVCAVVLLCSYSSLRLGKSAPRGVSMPVGIRHVRPAVTIVLFAFLLGVLLSWPLRILGQKARTYPAGVLSPGNALLSGLLRYPVPEVLVMRGAVELSDTEVLAVRADRPCYLRGGVYSIYTGRAWMNPLTFYGPPKPMREPIPENRKLVQYVTVLAGQPEELFGVADPVQISALPPLPTPSVAAVVNSEGCWKTEGPQRPGFRYKVVSDLGSESPARLVAAGTDYPKEIKDRYLTLAGLSKNDAVYRLARRITRNCESPYEKALAIEAYLSRYYVYDTDAPAAPAGDVVEHFLFRSRRGYCTAFASAMAVMLRELGVPTRLAVGFVADRYDPDRKVYEALDKDRHAWVEVYFPGYGWSTFDPTGAEEERRIPFWTILSHETRNALRRLLVERPWAVLILTLCLTIVYLVRPDLASRKVRLWRRRAPLVDAARREAFSHYRAMCKVAARTGAARRSDEPPSEYAERIARVPGLTQAVLDVVKDVTGQFESVRYGGTSPAPQDLTRMKLGLRLLKSLLRGRVRRFRNG